MLRGSSACFQPSPAPPPSRDLLHRPERGVRLESPLLLARAECQIQSASEAPASSRPPEPTFCSAPPTQEPALRSAKPSDVRQAGRPAAGIPEQEPPMATTTTSPPGPQHDDHRGRLRGQPSRAGGRAGRQGTYLPAPKPKCHSGRLLPTCTVCNAKLERKKKKSGPLQRRGGFCGRTPPPCKLAQNPPPQTHCSPQARRRALDLTKRRRRAACVPHGAAGRKELSPPPNAASPFPGGAAARRGGGGRDPRRDRTAAPAPFPRLRLILLVLRGVRARRQKRHR